MRWILFVIAFAISATVATATTTGAPDWSNLYEETPPELMDVIGSDTFLSTEEIEFIVEKALHGDGRLVQVASDRQFFQLFNYIKLENIHPANPIVPPHTALNEFEANDPGAQGLPNCGGYWDANWGGEFIEQVPWWYPYYYASGPNCYFSAPDDDCGADDYDYMLSFYFGMHDQSLDQLKPILRISTFNWWASIWLRSGVSARVYEQTRGGQRDNYDIYVCLDPYFIYYFETMQIKKIAP